MEWKIRDKEKSLNLNNQVIKKFLPVETLKDPKYTLYAYVEVIDDDLLVKFGEAKHETVFQRYAATGHLANKHMIQVWESDKGDKIIHKTLAKRAENRRGYEQADYDLVNSVEAYKINTLKGLDNLLADITELADSNTILKKETREDYKSIIELVNEILDINEKFYNLDLCARWGKTSTTLRLSKEYNKKENIRLFFMCSYVATVKHSYSDEIATLTNNENCLFIDPDNYENETEIKTDIDNWLKDDNHYIMYYVALTGDQDCFNRRMRALKKFNQKSVLYVEEADFGAHCDNQVKKIQSIFKKFNCEHVLSMTGSNSDRCETIFNM